MSVQQCIVLIALDRSDQPRYNHDLCRELPFLDETSTVDLTRRLIRDGLATWCEGEQSRRVNRPHRKYFCITDAGRQRAVQARSRLADFVVALEKLGVLSQHSNGDVGR
jgi:DNA-binding PadR family transcriptional regulator